MSKNIFTNKAHSLRDLGKFFGLEPNPVIEPRKRICHKCGAVMEHIQGTNAWVCHGTLKKKNKAGEVIGEEPCTNFSLSRDVQQVIVHPA